VSLLGGSAIVTGGGSGIGRAIAEAFAAQGTPVAIVDLLPEGGKETVATVAARGGRATFAQADVSRWDDVDRAIAAAVRELGPLGILVNAAGILDGYQPAAEMTPAVWERVVAIDLNGTFYGCRRALAEMLPRGRGRIVNIASVAGLVGSGGGPAYTASKHGVVGLTKVAALDYGARGVRVNAICPGTARTPMVDAVVRADPSIDAHLKSLHPIGRIGEASEIAEAAVWLCTPAASFVLGVALPVDGGYVVP
jgi:NAD(P)-dependent dehydrogenase (short-subunit alcohol dehydrogenase family)